MQSMAIVGLGNPGLEFVDSRHNLGFWLLDKFAEKFNLNFERLTGFSSLVSKFIRSGRNIYLIKPMQFMNHSGRELQKIFSDFSVSEKKLLSSMMNWIFRLGLQGVEPKRPRWT